MIRPLFVVVAALFFLLPLPPALADGPTVYRIIPQVGTSDFTDLAINTSRTIQPIGTSNVDRVVFTIELDDDNTSTSEVEMYCEVSNESGAPSAWARIQSVAVSSGVATSSDALWEKATSGDKTWSWTVDPPVSTNMRCVFSSTGAAATDVLSVSALVRVWQ